ncbi:cytochrome P450 family protein [Ceratobasidium sp. AG-Ba]|nr:cytochrome P450 family protein [Ceratobasidium sp. AG-Ba]
MEDAQSHFDEESNSDSDDQAEDAGTVKMNHVFRLLDLVEERGSGGLVEKVIIDQVDLHRLLNTVLPGSYNSVTKIDFKALDQLTIKPKGIYGAKAEIATFLLRVGCLNDDFVKTLDLLEDDAEPDPTSALRPGLYLALPPGTDSSYSTHEVYIFFWPENETWADSAPSAVQRNRVTFMRYLTKLCDQVVALVTESQAGSFIWDARLQNNAAPVGVPDHFSESRVFSFEVTATLEQEESVLAAPGFTIRPKLKLPAAHSRASFALSEKNTALVISTEQDAHSTFDRGSQTYTDLYLRNMVANNSPTIQLGSIDIEGILILGECGLRDKYPGPFSRYDRWKQHQEYIKSQQRGKVAQDIKADMPNIRQQAEYNIYSLLNQVYPDSKIIHERRSLNDTQYDTMRRKYPELDIMPNNNLHYLAMHIDDQQFQNLKLKWKTIFTALTAKPGQSDKDIKEIIDSTLNPERHGSQNSGSRKRVSSWNPITAGKKMYHATTSYIGANVWPVSRTQEAIPDQNFVHELAAKSQVSPTLLGLKSQMMERLHSFLDERGKEILRIHLTQVSEGAQKRRSQEAHRQHDVSVECQRQHVESELIEGLRSIMPLDQSNYVIINTLSKMSNSSTAGTRHYHMKSHHHELHLPRTRYDIYPLILTESDAHLCQVNKDHTPRPRIISRHGFTFTLETGRSLQFFETTGDKCLAVVGQLGRSELYIEDNHGLSSAINSSSSKLKLWHNDGQEHVYAFDQRTRLFAVYYGGSEEPRIAIYQLDERLKEIKGRGSVISLKRWYDNTVDIQNLCFVSGLEEICLIESFGRARVLSLVTEQFLPGSVQVTQQVVDACSSPDGACLLLTVADHGESTSQTKLLAFHWASFGTNQTGIEVVALPSVLGRTITSFEDRSRIYVLWILDDLTIYSTALHIKHKSTEFSLQSDGEVSRTVSVETSNNCLLDCHLEVWTRFPVLAAVTRSLLSPVDRQRRVITYVSTTGILPVEKYFARMISFFENTSRKPTGNILSSILVASSLEAPEVVLSAISPSTFQFGGFVMELLCLIPIHLAITRDNYFIPLKDGIWDPKHEQALLGADVTTVIDSLSIGWYESIFQSYQATKCVRVVSSMGEQSVGMHTYTP